MTRIKADVNVAGVELELSTADEVHDFQPVAFRKFRFRPQFAADDLAIQFDGNAVLLHAEFFEKSSERDIAIKILIIPVDDEFHARNQNA
jgi:hypothetical protein